MKVVSIQRKQRKIFLGEYSSPSNEVVPEELIFLAGAVFTLLLPTVVFCIALGQFLPFYLIALNLLVGVALGFVMFKKTSGIFPSCIPDLPISAPVVKPKKAA